MPTGQRFFRLALPALVMALFTATAPGAERLEKELTGEGWRLMLDRTASWIDDDIYLPPVDVASLPVNPPTCGWELLPESADRIVRVPGTVEEYFWGANGNPLGIAGDYRGVSWWSRSFTLDAPPAGKRVVLAFESVNLRAEVFVNRKLVGYDVIGNSPFEVDITDAVDGSGVNSLDIRITDPVGNFTWNDNELFRWGRNMVPAVHGFGGVTGRIFLRVTDRVHIADVNVVNSPAVTRATARYTIRNETGRTMPGTVSLTVHAWDDPDDVVWEKSRTLDAPSGVAHGEFPVAPRGVKPWNIDDPNLYVATVTFRSEDGSSGDAFDRRFGFRWFGIVEKDGDERFHLNGGRVFILAAMSRGFWPKNGIFPTPEMARRDIDTARIMGYNTAKFHRAAGQSPVMEYCDEVGHLVFEEPGGYRCLPEPDERAKAWRREKLRRLVVRDRSKPSLIMYNLKNEARIPPTDDDLANMHMIRDLDPARIVTYNSDRNRTVEHTVRLADDPFKSHLRPLSDTVLTYGWWDQHHWIRHVGWLDDYYENPRFHLRGVVNQATTMAPVDSLHRLDPGEIIFWGEEGAGGTMVRLGKIRNELARTGATGWREAGHLDYWREWDRFLDESGFRSSYPTVDNLTAALGVNLHYYHGRAIENVRLSNVGDAYILNGWASGGTHSDMVDAYRNPTADTSILAYYTRPLYVAVKLRDTVMPAGFAPVADFFIINEADLNGSFTLDVELLNPAGEAVFRERRDVRITGGDEFGELLAEGMELPSLAEAGHYELKARILDDGQVRADGHDRAFVVDWRTGTGIAGTCAVIDTTGTVQAFLAGSRGIETVPFDPDGPHYDIIIFGAHDFNEVRNLSYAPGLRGTDRILDRVINGATLVILENAERWAEYWDNQVLQYLNHHNWRRNGRLFVGRHPVLDGLPDSQAMNWEYQALYRGDIRGLNLGRMGVQTIVAAAPQHRKEILDALCRIPCGNGSIYLSTLRFMPEIRSASPQSASAKKLFLNILEIGAR